MTSVTRDISDNVKTEPEPAHDAEPPQREQPHHQQLPGRAEQGEQGGEARLLPLPHPEPHGAQALTLVPRDEGTAEYFCRK